MDKSLFLCDDNISKLEQSVIMIRKDLKMM